ncbi:MAG: response regulator, partial [Armatimonadota bacterium]|nr:response regulator [Armatimonadota bacterium]
MNPIQVLLIEDNPTDVLLIEETLSAVTSAQFEVTHVERLGAALERLGEQRFDAVLLDLGLPDSQGLETFDKLHRQYPQIPIVVLTGLDDETVAVQAVQAGAQDFLVKGQVDSHALARAIRHAIERQRAE